MTVRPNIEFEWQFLLSIQDASGSMHGPQTGYFLLNLKGEKCWISSIKQTNTAAFNTDG